MIRMGTIRDAVKTLSLIPVKERSSSITALLIDLNRIALHSDQVTTYFLLMDPDSVVPRKAHRQNFGNDKVKISVKPFTLLNNKFFIFLAE